MKHKHIVMAVHPSWPRQPLLLLCLLLADYHKDINHLYVIPLREFYSSGGIKVVTKASISHYQVPHSKGITLFCTSPLADQFLRLAVAVKNKIFMIAYKHPASMVYDGLPLTPSPSTDPKESFIKHRVSEINLITQLYAWCMCVWDNVCLCATDIK